MPRLFPRLVKEIRKQKNKQIKYFPLASAKKPGQHRTLYQPPRPKPSFHPSNHEKSILLGSDSPVTSSSSYVRHKRRRPSISWEPEPDERVLDPPRQMTEEEFAWWSNPYLRMLASPLRTCIISQKQLPSDLLIRLIGVHLPQDVQAYRKSSRILATLSPDGLLHPKYISRKVEGGAVYALCWRKTVESLKKGAYKRISGQLEYPSHLPDYVAHLLRLRVLQEFELLAERLEWAMWNGNTSSSGKTVLTRLSREQWTRIKATKTIPFRNVVAVLVVPPVNKDPTTKKQPEPSMSMNPPTDEDRPPSPPPLSELLPVSMVQLHDEPSPLPQLEVPLYNGITAFPSRSQRMALHNFLTRILKAERHFKRAHGTKDESPEYRMTGKASHAFVLFSEAGTVRRGDTAAVAKALWRLRMYEGDGWTDNKANT